MEPEKKEKVLPKKKSDLNWSELGAHILLSFVTAFVSGIAAEAGASVFRKITRVQTRDNLHLLKTGT